MVLPTVRGLSAIAAGRSANELSRVNTTRVRSTEVAEYPLRVQDLLGRQMSFVIVQRRPLDDRPTKQGGERSIANGGLQALPCIRFRSRRDADRPGRGFGRPLIVMMHGERMPPAFPVRF